MIPNTELVSMAVGDIRPAECIVLDWHDGPREGFIRFEVPASTWYFRLLAQTTDPDDLDTRIFWFSPAPDDTLPRLHEALRPLGPAERIVRLPDQLRRSLTWDQGKEMAAHARFSVETGLPVYFCDPAAPGSAAATKTPTASYASTSPNAPASPPTPKPTSTPWPPSSTGGLDKPSDG